MKQLLKTFPLSILLFLSLNLMAGILQQPMALLSKGTAFNEKASLPSLPSVIGVNDINTIAVTPVTDSSYHGIDTKYKVAVSRLKQQAASLEKYAKANNFNTDLVFLVDMTLPSGKNRFFVYNLKKDEVEASSLVTHGFGSNKYDNDDPLEFSNMPQSKKTSIGKYKIGKSYSGRFGLAYKLYGLDSTNDRAFERDIVLHAHARVPDKEPFPGYIIVSSGCPTVSLSFLTSLDTYIKASKKPILLWIYN